MKPEGNAPRGVRHQTEPEELQVYMCSHAPKRESATPSHLRINVTLMISSWEPGSLMWLLSKPSPSVVPLHMAYALPGPCCSCTAIMLDPTKKMHTSLSVHASATAGDTLSCQGGFHQLEPDHACNPCLKPRR